MANSGLAERKCLGSVLSVGDLVKDGTYLLHSAFSSAANFVSEDGAFVCLVCAEKGAGPFNIMLNGGFPDSPGTLKIKRPAIELDGLAADTGNFCVYDSSVLALKGEMLFVESLEREYLDLAPSLSLALALDASRVSEFLPGFQRAFAARVSQACALFYGEDFADCVRLLNGAGFGFTPSGDDFIAGALLASHFFPSAEPARNEIFAAVSSSNPVSSAAFRAAYEGHACEPVKNLLLALSNGEDTATHLRAVLGMGATSGADFLAGFIFAFKSFKGDGRC